MSEMTVERITFTPGPWKVSEVADGEGRRHVERDGVSVAIICARRSSPASGPQFFEKDANARLIAAAPDLLVAAKAVRATCPCDPDINAAWLAAWDSLVAAIAKAEGGA